MVSHGYRIKDLETFVTLYTKQSFGGLVLRKIKVGTRYRYAYGNWHPWITGDYRVVELIKHGHLWWSKKYVKFVYNPLDK